MDLIKFIREVNMKGFKVICTECGRETTLYQSITTLFELQINSTNKEIAAHSNIQNKGFYIVCECGNCVEKN
jgi:hypothetical protein